MLVAVFVEEVPRLRRQDCSLPSPVLDFEAVMLIDQLPNELRRHAAKSIIGNSALGRASRTQCRRLGVQ